MKLAENYDFVLTTYGIMQRESGLTESELMVEKAKREVKSKKVSAATGKKKGTMPFIPPEKHTLHHIEWNRVVLDESHSVKTIKNVQSKSCRNLKSLHRWCLTGTPFNTSLKDLDGQLRFVGMVAPLNNAKWWEEQERAFLQQSMRGLKNQSASLLKVISACVMRHKKDQTFNGKAIVELPPREEIFVELEMSKSEKEVYTKLKTVAKHIFDTLKNQGGIDRKTLQLRAALLPERMSTSGIVDLHDLEEKYKNAVNNPVKVFDTTGIQHAQEESFNDVNECPICLEIPEDPLQTPCRHIFCSECIKGVLDRKPSCPFCRQPCKSNKLKKPPKKKEEKEMEIENNKKEEMELDTEEQQFEFETKLNYLMDEIHKLARDSPREKILIFTTFKKSLQRVAERLIEADFNYRCLKGDMTMGKRTNQLKSFIQEKNCRIFLLSVRTGAVGITLTAASRIFMMEPLMNKALYDQAVNRCHRLGQKKIVRVQTLMLKDTIEPKIQKMAEAIKSGDVRTSYSTRGKKTASIKGQFLRSLFE